jgi:hypothetical protein
MTRSSHGAPAKKRKLKYRKRDHHDRDFRVVLTDTSPGNQRPITIPGTFYGRSPSDAIDMAMKTYPGLFASMETRSWIAEAYEDFSPPTPAPAT